MSRFLTPYKHEIVLERQTLATEAPTHLYVLRHRCYLFGLLVWDNHQYVRVE